MKRIMDYANLFTIIALVQMFISYKKEEEEMVAGRK